MRGRERERERDKERERERERSLCYGLHDVTESKLSWLIVCQKF